MKLIAPLTALIAGAFATNLQDFQDGLTSELKISISKEGEDRIAERYLNYQEKQKDL